jgi:short-subunit dehydrogenase
METVFITGATSGLGAALALHYAHQGAVLGIVGRDDKKLMQLHALLPNPGMHKLYRVDVNDHTALADAANAFIDSVGIVNIVIASAGISVGTLTEEQSDMTVFSKVIETNLTATVATFGPFIQHMRDHSPGHSCRLVGIASVAGIRGLPGAGAYSASKAALISYCESLRLELRASGVKVVTIVPGYIDTPMTQKNEYNMPFLLPAGEFAESAARAIARASSYCVIPWQMGVVAKLLRVLPNWLYDRLAANAPQKARQLPSAIDHAPAITPSVVPE